MKKILNTIILFFVAFISYGQIEIQKTIKPNNGSCDGKVLLGFIESEIPGTLTITPSNQSNPAGGQIAVGSTSYVLKDLCPDTYTFSFKDNHGCVTEKELDLGECDLDEVQFEITRVDCEIPSSYSIQAIGGDEYYYQWSNGSLESGLPYVGAGQYSVTVTDESGCIYEEDFTIQITEPSIIGLNEPTLDGDGCNGSIQILAEGNNAPFVIQVRSNSELIYESGYDEFEEGAYILPVSFCVFMAYNIIITDVDGCVTYLQADFSEVEGCNNLELVVSTLWHVSNGSNGKLGFSFKKDYNHVEDFTFKLGIKNDDEEYEEIKSQQGNALFENLIKGSYIVVAVNNSNPQCYSVQSDFLVDCPRKDDPQPITHINHITNNNNGEIIVNYTYPCSLPYPCHIHGIIYLKSPSGKIIHDWKNTKFGYSRVYSNLSEEGTYKVTVDNGCGQIVHKDLVLKNCPPRVNLSSWDGWNPWFKPSKRDLSVFGSDYDKMDPAFKLSSNFHHNDEICSLDYNIDYIDIAALPTWQGEKFFEYTPFDATKPCNGGVLKSWFVQWIGQEKSVVFNEQIEINDPAVFQFDWNNTDIPNPQSLWKLHKYIFQVKSSYMDENEWDICKEGTYCLFNSLDVFENADFPELILASTCKEYSHPCDLFPNSYNCVADYCTDGVQNNGETGIDCGGHCLPCNNGTTGDPLDDCFNNCIEGQEECVEGECLTICNTQNPCPIGYNCNEDGHCIESEGPCDDGDCPEDGQECINGYCYEVEEEGVCENPCEITLVNSNPSLQSEHVTVSICISTGGFPELLVYENEDLTGDLFYSYIYEYLEPGNHDIIIPESVLPLGPSFIVFENDGCQSNIKPHIVIFGLKNNNDDSETRDLNIKSNDKLLFVIYPNPNKGNFTIENLSDETIKELYMYDINGKRINVSQIRLSNKIEIDIENVSKGVYFLEILSNSNRYFHRVVVQ